MKNKLIELFGWYGTTAVIGAYALTSFNIVDTQNIIYQLLNVTGSIGIVSVSLSKKVYQPAVLNIIWAGIGLIALLSIVL